jgi:hypothetical protein
MMSVDELRDELRGAGFEIVEAAPLRGTVLQVVAPRLAARLRGIPFQIANLLGSLLFGRLHRYAVMTYCVARKPAVLGT